MARARRLVTLGTLLVCGGVAAAQPGPVDPYAPAPAPAAAPAPAPPSTPAPAPAPAPSAGMPDPAMAEQVAASLVARAQDLFDAGELPDAKQLAVEAIVTAGQGPSADAARALIHRVNVQLHIPEDAPAPHPTPTPTPVTPPPADANALTQAATPEPGHGQAHVAAMVHVGLYTGALGATIGAAVGDARGATGPVALGVVGAAAGAAFLAPVLERHFDEAQLRTIGSGSVWGGVFGGLVADLTTGVGVGSDGTSPRQVLIGTTIGATVGGLAGWGLASQKKLTRGDVALVDTLAGIGTLGGLTIGMLMQPAQSEAYDLNAVLGGAGGIIAGLVAAPTTNTTPRRMLRVAEYAAVGGLAPFLLYAAIYDANSSADERVTGLLSTVGMIGGAYLGFRATATWDEHLDVPDGGLGHPAPKADAPPAIVGRASDGGWQVGAPALGPLSRQLDNHQHGVGLTLFGARF